MEVITTKIPGLLILKPRVFEDARGYFYESFRQEEFDKIVGERVEFVQDNQSKSSRNVLRGLHFQRPPHAQAKLVKCVRGSVIDIAVDIRKGSPTFGDYVAVELSESNNLQFYIPHGFAHGFAVTSESAVFQYKCDNYYDHESEGGLSILDADLNLQLPFPIEQAIMSDKDMHYPTLAEFVTPFEYKK